MKRKITELEKELIANGWVLSIKRYTGKHSERTLCYEYHKMSDLRDDNKVYEQVIELDISRAQIGNYYIKNVIIDKLDDMELCKVRFLFLELRKFVEKLVSENKNLQKLANEIKDVVENTILEKTGIDLKSNVIVPITEETLEETAKFCGTFEQLDEDNQEKEEGD